MRTRFSLTTACALVVLLLTASGAAAWSLGKDRIEGSGNLETRELDDEVVVTIEVCGG